MSTTKELEMIYAARAVGSIGDMNGHATASLTRFIERQGKVFEDLTIREVVALLPLHRDEREALYLQAEATLARRSA